VKSPGLEYIIRFLLAEIFGYCQDGHKLLQFEAATLSTPYVSSIFQILFFSFWNYREFGHKRKNSGFKSDIYILSFGIF